MVDLVHPNANGTVFIYYGSGDEVITASLQQVLEAHTHTHARTHMHDTCALHMYI